MTDKVPCRIQFWHDGDRFEYRGYLQRFSTVTPGITDSLATFPERKVFTPQDREASLKMDIAAIPWKFERGKPKVSL